MRLLRITNSNGTYDVDLDDKTAIGFDLQAYDIKEPGNRKISVSNQFTVPATSNNMKIFGCAGNVQSTSTLVYEEATCNYWIDNIQLIKDARIRYEQFDGERISLFIFEKPSIWDEMKLLPWPDFVGNFLTWLKTEKGLETDSSPFTGNWQEFVTYYSDITNPHKLFIGMFFGNLFMQPNDSDPSENYENLGSSPNYNPKIYIGLRETVYWSKCGHFCTHIKTIFEYIEYLYNVNFYTSGGEIIGNIWDDTVVLNMFTPIRDIEVRAASFPIGDYWFDVSTLTKYFPFDITNDKAEKTLYDFVNSFFQHLNIVIDKNTIEDNDNDYKLRRFDTLENIGEIIDWSNLDYNTKPIFKPSIDGFNQNNYIRFKEIYPEGDKTQNQKLIECNNVNLDAETNLFEIDAYINNLYELNDGSFIPNLTNKESFKTFHFFLPSEDNLINDAHIYYRYNFGGLTEYMAIEKPVIPVLYSLDSEYQLLESMLTNPVYYEVKKWLSLYDVYNLEFFKKYYIRELNGCFFLNKISGFNPEKSNESTTLELIKISNETPYTPYMGFWVDGINNIWTDGAGNYYY